MKKSLFVIGCVFSTLSAQADSLTCAVVLDSQVKTINVEKNHVIDVCGDSKSNVIEWYVLGDEAHWRVELDKSKTILYIAPRVEGAATNILIYLSGDTMPRYELKLRSIPPNPQ